MKRRRKDPPRLPVPDDYIVMGDDLIPAEVVKEICTESLEISNEPSWREDPTYNLRRRKKGQRIA